MRLLWRRTGGSFISAVKQEKERFDVMKMKDVRDRVGWRYDVENPLYLT